MVMMINHERVAVLLLAAFWTFYCNNCLVAVEAGLASSNIPNLHNQRRSKTGKFPLVSSEIRHRHLNSSKGRVNYKNETHDVMDPPSMNCDPSAPNRRYDELACWLWNLTVDIPDQTFRKNIFKVSITDMSCTHFAVGSVNSTYKHVNETTAALNAIASNVVATCSGKYHSTGLSGRVEASVDSKSNKPAFVLEPYVLSKEVTALSYLMRVPTTFSTQQCVANLEVPAKTLHFEGSISAKVIDLFKGSIASYISSALEKQLCPLLTRVLDQKLTSLLEDAVGYMLKTIGDGGARADFETVAEEQQFGMPPSGPMIQSGLRLVEGKESNDAAASEDDNELIDFQKDTPILTSALEVANDLVLDRYLHKGFALDLMELAGLVDANGTTVRSCGYFFRGIDGLIEEFLKGHLVYPLRHRVISFVIPSYAEIALQFQKVVFDGLDGLDRIQVFAPNQAQSFSSFVESSKGFNMTAVVDLTITAIPGGHFKGGPLEETFEVHVDTSNVNITLDAGVAINKTVFGNLTASSAIEAVKAIIGKSHDRASETIGCIVEPLQSIQLDALSVVLDLTRLSIMEVENEDNDDEGISNVDELERDLDILINNFLTLALSEYHEFVKLFLTAYLKGPAVQLINKVSNKWVRKLADRFPTNASLCEAITKPPSPNGTDFFNFYNYEMFDKFNRFLNDTKTIKSINSYMTCLGDVIAQQIRQNSPVVDVANITVSLRHFTLDKLTQLESFNLLLPEDEGYNVRNEAELVGPNVSAVVDLILPALNASGSTSISASLGNSMVSAIGLLLYNVSALRPLPLIKLLSREYCVAAPLQELDFYSGSDMMEQMSWNWSIEIDGLTDDVIHASLDSIKYPSVSAWIKTFAIWSFASALDSINAITSYVMERAGQHCYDEENKSHGEENLRLESTTLKIALYCFLMFVIANLALFTVLSMERNRHPNHVEDGNEEHEHSGLFEPLMPRRPQEDEVDDIDAHNQAMINMGSESGEDVAVSSNREEESAEPLGKSLFHDDTIDPIVRHALPILILVTIALLFSSNLTVGASVDLVAAIGMQKYPLSSLFSFSLFNTICEMWNAKIYALLLLVVVFSGIWPYLKLVLMLVAWFTPSNSLSVTRRGKLLFSLDALGKFSLVDTFVLILMMVSFRYHASIGDKGGAMVDVFVNPMYGFFGFLLATTLSLLAGHVMLFMHRKSLLDKTTIQITKESTFGHTFSNGTTELRMSMTLKTSLLFLMLLATSLMFIGIFKQSFVFEIGGLAGALIGDDRRKVFSLLSLGSAIPQSLQHPDTSGILCLQLVYFFYTLVTPFVCLGALLCILVLPLTLSSQREVLAVAEIANAWSAIEVFALSIVVALFEISTFASFIVGDNCDLLDEVLANEFQEQVGDNPTCYSVDASVRWNVLYLVVGVLVNSFVVSFLFRVIHSSIAERQRAAVGNGEEAQLNPGADELDILGWLAESPICWLLFVPVDGDPNESIQDGPLSVADRHWEDEKSLVSQLGEQQTQ